MHAPGGLPKPLPLASPGGEIMPSRNHIRRRDALWARCQDAAGIVTCPHCDLPVQPSDQWDECHVGKPKWLGGKATRVGHHRCNEADRVANVMPVFHKTDQQRKKHHGISGAGLGACPMRHGRRTMTSKTFRHGIVPRLTHAQKHAATMKKLGRNPSC
jgi:hypothetical protein